MADEPRPAKSEEDDVRCGGFPAIPGNDIASQGAFLVDAYAYVVTCTRQAIDWYLAKKQWVKRGARATRLMAILFTTLGGLAPLVAASGLLPKNDIDFAQFGYVCLGLAGACIGLDRFFGFSAAWMRYMTTSGILQRLLQEFCFDWAILCASSQQSAPGLYEQKVKRLQGFLLRTMGEVEKETAEWAANYRSSLAEMEKAAREQLEASKPGRINVKIENATTAAGGVIVYLNDVPMQTATQAECLLPMVPPGEHIVKIEAVNARNVIASAKVRVEPGNIHEVTMKLPDLP